MAIVKIKIGDLKVGMFVQKVDGGWLSTPFKTNNILITKQREINKLAGYKIKGVYIDTERGRDVGEPAQTKPIKDKMFTAKFSDFVEGRDIPVDIFLKNKTGGIQLLIRKNDPYTEEIGELFHGADIGQVMIPVNQKELYDRYKRSLEQGLSAREEKGFSGKFVDPKKVAAEYEFMVTYHAVNPFALVPNVTLPFGIFIKEKSKISEVTKKGSRLSGALRKEWIEKDTNALILAKDKPVYRLYMREHTKKNKDEKTRAAFIREDAKIIVDDLAKNPRSEKLMAETKGSVMEITQMVMDNPTTFYGLTKINNHDYYTFTHSINVATLSISLAIGVGVNEKDALGDLGLGSVLHDIGKSQVDDKILNKPGNLTEAEYKKMKHHVTLGYKMLINNRTLSKRTFYPLLQHHEKISGNGYPNNLRGDDIHLFGRISAIIDIYDAMTTQRSYKKAFSPFDSLSFLSKNKNDFDMELLAQLVTMIQKQEV